MSHNYYSEINLHITWHTKESHPLITPRVEEILYPYLQQRLKGMEDVFTHIIGGIETHLHLAVTVPPTLLISELVGQIKGIRPMKLIKELDSEIKSFSGNLDMGW